MSIQIVINGTMNAQENEDVLRDNSLQIAIKLGISETCRFQNNFNALLYNTFYRDSILVIIFSKISICYSNN